MTANTAQTDPMATSRLLRFAVLLSGLTGASGVALLAISAHADTTGLLKTAAQMLLFHAPALLGLGIVTQVRNVTFLPAAFALMTVGLSLFCGDLIARAFFGVRLFPMAAPIGGSLTIISWLVLAFSAVRIRPR